jgi:hypothetical protein
MCVSIHGCSRATNSEGGPEGWASVGVHRWMRAFSAFAARMQHAVSFGPRGFRALA